MVLGAPKSKWFWYSIVCVVCWGGWTILARLRSNQIPAEASQFLFAWGALPHLIPRDVFDFIYATQPKEWEKFKKTHGQDAKERLLKRLASEVEHRGTLEVLRKGIKCDGSRFRLA